MSDTREKILDTAFDMFYTKGYQGSGITEILNEANVNRGSLYHFFKSKKELALTVIDERLKYNLQKKYELLSTSQNPIDDLFLIFEDTKEFDFKRGCALSNLIQEMSPLDKDFELKLQEVYNALFEWVKLALDNAIEKNQIKSNDTFVLAHLIVATVEGAIMASKAFQNSKHYHMIVDELKKSLCNSSLIEKN